MRRACDCLTSVGARAFAVGYFLRPGKVRAYFQQVIKKGPLNRFFGESVRDQVAEILGIDDQILKDSRAIREFIKLVTMYRSMFPDFASLNPGYERDARFRRGMRLRFFIGLW
jgi:hypothetical protein